MFNGSRYNPDVLTCLANLSSDEVFTPPSLANQMLDLFPSELWSDPNVTFLDPSCKSGVFLREIAKRLEKGLEEKIPDRQMRLNHIFKNQLYGLAITELTALISRRSVYCSKTANGRYSICDAFENPQGNIFFRRLEHTWTNGRCVACGANEENYSRDRELETHAYLFIHEECPKEIEDMQFDVIIGNPPYQLSDGGDQNEGARNRGGAIPIYHLFVQKAKKMNPRFLTMIIPSRWFTGGRGLDEFRASMLNDQHIRKLVDYPVSSECFPGVEIKGGVCYFLWDRDTPGLCETKTLRNNTESIMVRPLLEPGTNVFLRYNGSISIFRKVQAKTKESFCSLVSPQKPFGFRTFYKGKKEPFEGSVTLYGNSAIEYVSPSEIEQNYDWVNKHKIYITMAYGAGEDFPHQIINKPIYGPPNTCCTETYLVIGPFPSKSIVDNVMSYIRTRFFRFLVLLHKNTQHAPRGAYSFVPMQNFHEPWSDEKLYKKYNLTKDEITLIEAMVRPMEVNGE